MEMVHAIWQICGSDQNVYPCHLSQNLLHFFLAGWSLLVLSTVFWNDGQSQVRPAFVAGQSLEYVLDQ